VWRFIEDDWLFCHWWQDQTETRLSAMFLLLILLALSALVIALAICVSLDGYGSRPGPRSRPRDPFEPSRADDHDLPVR
jgi:hypothetical protein